MPKLKKPRTDTVTTESTAYLGGLMKQFREQSNRYHQLTGHLLSIQAQIELTEKTLSLTRDHLAMVIQRTEFAHPNDWETVLRSVRFVGVRLADACSVLLQEHKKLSPEQILGGLNEGMFRFRTSSPLREIHAALLRQSFAKKSGKQYVWLGTAQRQIPLRMRVIESPVTPQVSVKAETLPPMKEIQK
jgi:hypothetical protein